jgi:hypothetical protein
MKKLEKVVNILNDHLRESLSYGWFAGGLHFWLYPVIAACFKVKEHCAK